MTPVGAAGRSPRALDGGRPRPRCAGVPAPRPARARSGSLGREHLARARPATAPRRWNCRTACTSNAPVGLGAGLVAVPVTARPADQERPVARPCSGRAETVSGSVDGQPGLRCGREGSVRPGRACRRDAGRTSGRGRPARRRNRGVFQVTVPAGRDRQRWAARNPRAAAGVSTARAVTEKTAGGLGCPSSWSGTIRPGSSTSSVSGRRWYDRPQSSRPSSRAPARSELTTVKWCSTRTANRTGSVGRRVVTW